MFYSSASGGLFIASLAHPASRPGCLYSLIMLPKPRPKTKGPRWPLQWKADGQSSDGSRLQSAVQERKLLIHRHPSSRLGERGGRRAGGGKTEHCLTPSVWPLSNAFAWHIHGSHSYTHVLAHAYTHTLTHSHTHTLTHSHTHTLTHTHLGQ